MCLIPFVLALSLQLRNESCYYTAHSYHEKTPGPRSSYLAWHRLPCCSSWRTEPYHAALTLLCYPHRSSDSTVERRSS